MVSIQNGARQMENLLLGVWGQLGMGLLLALFALRPLTTCTHLSRQIVEPGLLRNQVEQLPGEI